MDQNDDKSTPKKAYVKGEFEVAEIKFQLDSASSLTHLGVYAFIPALPVCHVADGTDGCSR